MGSAMRRAAAAVAIALTLGTWAAVAQQAPGRWVTDKYAKLPQPSEEYTNVVVNNRLYLIGGNAAVFTPGARATHPARVMEYDLAGGLEQLCRKMVDLKFTIDDFRGDRFVRLRSLKKTIGKLTPAGK